MYATSPAIFRKMARIQDSMLRAVMPRTADIAPRPVPPASGQRPRLVRRPDPLTFTLAESMAVARG
jgi:hypothetical protein